MLLRPMLGPLRLLLLRKGLRKRKRLRWRVEEVMWKSCYLVAR